LHGNAVIVIVNGWALTVSSAGAAATPDTFIWRALVPIGGRKINGRGPVARHMAVTEARSASVQGYL
jgi:hypothetical protein